MLAATFAQRYHWYEVGSARQRAIADWQVSRVASVLGYAELALRFGERSLAICLDNDLDAFVTGFAHEAIARAAAEVDDVDTFTQHLETAKEKLLEIEDAEDRDVLEADLTEMSER
jgi:phage shock protein A